MQRMDNMEVTTPLTSTSQFIEAGEHGAQLDWDFAPDGRQH